MDEKCVMKPADQDPHIFQTMLYNFENAMCIVGILGRTW